jgi:hypothetical protein
MENDSNLNLRTVGAEQQSEPKLVRSRRKANKECQETQSHLINDIFKKERRETIRNQFLTLRFLSMNWPGYESLDILWNQKMTRSDRIQGVVLEFDTTQTEPPENLPKWTDSKCFSSFVAEEDQFQRFIENKGHMHGHENYESLTKCQRCNKNKIVSSAKQTRSADEPMTVTHFCTHCQHRWTV